MDQIRCARCGTRLTPEAPRCTECGADPRTGVPSLKRDEADRVRVCQGVWIRALAVAIDGVVLFFAWLLISLVWYLGLVGTGSFADITKAPSANALWVVAGVGLPLYFWLSQAIWGRTLGMRFCSLRVVTRDGGRPGTAATLVRTVLMVVDWLPLLFVLGAAAIWLTPRNQRLGDLAARTVVTRTRRVSAAHLQTGRVPVVPWPGGTS
jgi:uncharacterized RDD family membrane protein YckC